MDQHHGLAQPQTTSTITGVGCASLPFDMLSKVFFDCLPDGGFPGFSRKEAPLLLCRVCRHWRTVALASHLLWAKLTIRKHSNGTIVTTPSLAIGVWISRAGQCTLSFRFVNFEFSFEERIGIITSILPYRKRWEHLEGHLIGQQWLTIRSAISEGAPLLQYIDISLPPFENNDPEMRLSATPVLRSLILHSHHNILGLEACTRTLQLLSVYVRNLDECLSYLVHCPSLKFAKLKGNFPVTSPTPEGFRTLEMQQILTLKLHVSFAGPLLDRLHSPVLESLCFGSLDAGFVVSSFISRCSPPLATLIIFDSAENFSSNDLLDCLRCCPSLTFLIVRNRMWLGNTDMDQLQLGSERDKNICPRLEQIYLSCCGRGNMSHVEDMVLSRWKGADDVVSSASLDCTSAQSYRWERNLRQISLDTCDFEDYSSNQSIYFIKRPKIAKCIEEGLFILEEPPWR
ncbi:hypothetical protein BD410DRAFT_359575 [Rickenella mellea]|uniref:Uncharacterized protein n=1 Tax=Rickenella mellea TaxID=50990 RepID=A0A4Y7PZL1_9AGAM|nr:hypothetical protein BD410DRAFT_359575 [Rickenella mellea]